MIFIVSVLPSPVDEETPKVFDVFAIFSSGFQDFNVNIFFAILIKLATFIKVFEIFSCFLRISIPRGL